MFEQLEGRSSRRGKANEEEPLAKPFNVCSKVSSCSQSASRGVNENGWLSDVIPLVRPTSGDAVIILMLGTLGNTIQIGAISINKVYDVMMLLLLFQREIRIVKALIAWLIEPD